MKFATIFRTLITLGLLALCDTALAHPGHGIAADFGSGFRHPFGGLDHILVMVAVGLWAAMLGGAARWLLPLSFVGTMTVGATLAMSGIEIPAAELGIQGSLLVLGLALAGAWWFNAFPAALLTGFFALFHGYLHGSEMAGNSDDGLLYGLGFLAATSILHGMGLLLGLRAARASRSGWIKAIGASCAAFGLYLFSAG